MGLPEAKAAPTRGRHRPWSSRRRRRSRTAVTATTAPTNRTGIPRRSSPTAGFDYDVAEDRPIVMGDF